MSKLDAFIADVKQSFPDDRLTYQKGIATFHPENGAEAAALFRMANQARQQLFITGFGNQIDPVGEKFADLMTLRSDRLNTLLKVAAGDFYIEVGAGYPLRELNQELSEYGLFLPHSDLPYVGSIAGAIAVGLTAQRGTQPLPLSRYLIMAEIATPTGDLIKPGSACFKSVSGFDIVKIYFSSWGMLGMIVTVTLRVLPFSIKDEYNTLVQNAIDYRKFYQLYQEPEENISARYSLRIKSKFDPKNILPLIAV